MMMMIDDKGGSMTSKTTKNYGIKNDSSNNHGAADDADASRSWCSNNHGAEQ